MANYYTEACSRIEMTAEQAKKITIAVGLYGELADKELLTQGITPEQLDAVLVDQPADELEGFEPDMVEQAIAIVCKVAAQMSGDDLERPLEVDLDECPDGLLVSSDENINLDHAAALLSSAFEVLGMSTVAMIEWSNTCDRTRPDAFGGGVLVVSAHEVRSIASYDAGCRLVDLLSGNANRRWAGYGRRADDLGGEEVLVIDAPSWDDAMRKGAAKVLGVSEDEAAKADPQSYVIELQDVSATEQVIQEVAA